MVDDPFYALDVAMDVFENSGRDESSKVALIGACAAVLESAGYVCLKKHTEPPKEEGRYLVYNDRGANVLEKDEFAPVEMADGRIERPDSSLGIVAGPLPPFVATPRGEE